jgi:hypothetical protein
VGTDRSSNIPDWFKKIDAIADEKNTFSAWGSKEYVERLTRDNYGKKPSEFNCFQY